LPERIAKIVERTEKSKAITYRPINKKKWNQEMAAMFEIYNDAWEKNWGFVPFTWEEFKHVGDSLKMVVKEELVVFVEVAGEPAAFAVTLPDYNQVFKKITNGRLFPTGFYHLLRADHTINRLRVITLGIRKKFGHLGLGGLMYNYLVNTSHRMGYIDAELSWILETNTSMINPMKLMGAELIKKYRLFEKRLDLQ
ncbi:MAG: N-acetyltransferase, partial [Pseudomonadota bacterium]